MWLVKHERMDIDGKIYLGHNTKDGSHRLWRQNNLQAAKANSRRQASKSRARFREQWHEYQIAYLERFPGTRPVGFDRWCRVGRAHWLEHGVSGLLKNADRGMVADIQADFDELRARLQPKRQTGTH